MLVELDLGLVGRGAWDELELGLGKYLRSDRLRFRDSVEVSDSGDTDFSD